MNGVYVGLLAGGVALTVGFLIAVGRPSKHGENAPAAWFLAVTGWAGLAVDAALIVALLGRQVPAVVALLVLAIQDAVFAWRLWLMLRARRHR